MPSYFRFPEAETIQQRFWGCRPRNPSCGTISLEKGTKIFAWGNMIYGACFSIVCILLFMAPLFINTNHSHQDVVRQLKQKGYEEEWIEKMYLKQSFGVLQTILFLIFIMFSCLWFVSWKLKKAIVERDLPQLKKYYFLILCLIILISIPVTTETEIMWSKAALIDIPFYILEVMGLVFTHAYIVSLISPDSSQHDDLNRIQFNA